MSTTGVQASTGTQASGVKALGEQAFLRLLTTQLQYQDPLKPMDNVQFVTQLAQFSQLEQTTDLKNRMDSSLQYLASLNTYGAAGLLGREVQVSGGGLSLGSERPMTLQYRVAGNARVGIRVTDATGTTVRFIDAGAQAAGAHEAAWDGRDNQGRLLPNGQYTYQVSAVDTAGDPVTSTTFTVGRVTGVSTEGGAVSLTVNGERVAASDVVGIAP
ncbi:MAG: flagellar hook assembly protein FlgD [Nitrospirae bacterium]|nr:flagellar hook assembly protein FlgD [Nitrospirota bacterium]